MPQATKETNSNKLPLYKKISLQDILDRVQIKYPDRHDIIKLMGIIHDNSFMKDTCPLITIKIERKKEAEFYTGEISAEQMNAILHVFENKSMYVDIEPDEIRLLPDNNSTSLLFKAMQMHFTGNPSTLIKDRTLPFVLRSSLISLLLLEMIREHNFEFRAKRCDYLQVSLDINDDSMRSKISAYFEKNMEFNVVEPIAADEQFCRFATSLIQSINPLLSLIDVDKVTKELSGIYFDDIRESSGILIPSRTAAVPSQVIHEFWKDDARLFTTCLRQVDELLKLDTKKRDLPKTTNPLFLKKLRHQFKLDNPINSQFSVAAAYIFYYWAANLAEYYPEPVDILDTSNGWGDRAVAAFHTPNVNSYTGIDPNLELIEPFEKMKAGLSIHSKTPALHLISEPAEHCLLDHKVKYQVAFTCPPYYTLEKYSSDKSQSINQFKKYDEWKNHFLYKVMELTRTCLVHNAIMAIVIKNIHLDKKNIEIADDTVTKFKEWKNLNQVYYVKEYVFKTPGLCIQDVEDRFNEMLFVVKINTLGSPTAGIPNAKLEEQDTASSLEMDLEPTKSVKRELTSDTSRHKFELSQYSVFKQPRRAAKQRVKFFSIDLMLF